MNTTIDLLATASRFAIAAAIIYFAYQLAQINDNVPVITQSVEQVSRHIEPTLEEVKQVRLEIARVRELVPDILAEVTKVRQQVPPIIAQVESVNQQIDPLLSRLEKTVAVIDETQQQIPQILNTADDAIVALNATRKEVLPMVPQVLEEIKLTRESIDPTLDRVDGLVEDVFFKAQNAITAAEGAGKKASEGAVSGFFTGLIKLPFKFIGSLASPIVDSLDVNVARKLTEKDIELLAEAGTQAIKSKNIGKERRWENPKSGNSGSITIIGRYALQGLECVEARVRVSRKGKQIGDDLEKFCLNEKNEWVSANNIEK
jgi:surface antigen/regulator of replication initiation timing